MYCGWGRGLGSGFKGGGRGGLAFRGGEYVLGVGSVGKD